MSQERVTRELLRVELVRLWCDCGAELKNGEERRYGGFSFWCSECDEETYMEEDYPYRDFVFVEPEIESLPPVAKAKGAKP